MKKKVLTGLLASVLLLSSVAAVVISVNHFNNGPSTEDFIVQNKQYQSAIGGNVLDITDKDYVNIDDSSFDVSTLVATDDLGRNLSTDGTGDNGRQVAVFYNLNFDGLGTTQIFQDLLDANKPLSSGSMYWWGKPLFGYYLSSDTWVMRKHIEMFTLADVDYLVFDTTNDKAFTTQALKLMHLLHEYNEMGWDAPKVAFYTNTESAIRMLSIYSDIYSQNKYPDTSYEDWVRILKHGTFVTWKQEQIAIIAETSTDKALAGMDRDASTLNLLKMRQDVLNAEKKVEKPTIIVIPEALFFKEE